MYRVVDAGILRAAAHPDTFTAPRWPDLTDTGEAHAAGQLKWIRQVWSDGWFAAAVADASPVLARRVQALCNGEATAPREVRRAAESLSRYVLRARHRATPFGHFAGVAPVRLGRDLLVHRGGHHRMHAKVDEGWLTAAIDRLESCGELRPRLPVVTNNLCFRRGDRLVIGCTPRREDAERSRLADHEPTQVSVRYTAAVATVTQTARSPVTCRALADKVQGVYPQVGSATIDAMIAELLARGILVSSLRPPGTIDDPISYVLDELTAIGADSLSGTATTVRRIRCLHERLADRSAGALQRVAEPRPVRTPADDTEAPPIAVVTELDCDLALPPAVIREAASAASLLARLSPCPSGSSAWRDYRHRFLERYGPDTLVPVTELVNADTGLGYPAGYRDSALAVPTAPLSERDQALLALAQRAALDGTLEVALDEQRISDLAPDPPRELPPSVELAFHLHARNKAALQTRAFDLVVASVSRAAGSLTGRFLHALPRHLTTLAAAYTGLPTMSAGAVAAQISCRALYARADTLGRAPRLLPLTVAIGEHHAGGGHLVPLDDLAVGCDGQRMYLLSLSRGRLVEPTVFNAVDFTNHAHPLARFLCELPKAHAAAVTPFSWGHAARLPFLPRIRHGRVVLCSARWRLTATEMPSAHASWSDWRRKVEQWRERRNVPDHVEVGTGDLRLHLDLDEPAHLALLRSELVRQSVTTVTEAPEPAAYGWFDGRAHEIVLTLTRAAAPMSAAISSSPTPATRTRRHFPGASSVLYAKVYAHPERHSEILTSYLPDLATGTDPLALWFLRYRDPDPHLRLRIRITDLTRFGSIAAAVGAWAADLHRRGLISHLQLDTYMPEVGRYGAGPTMAAAEDVFIADSRAANAELRECRDHPGTHPHALVAASLTDLACSFTGATADGMTWLIQHIKKAPAPAVARSIYDQTMRYTRGPDAGGRARESALGAAWEQRRTTLAAYRRRLDQPAAPDPDRVLASLLHLHCIRAIGIDEPAERTTYRLARAAALAWTTRYARAR
jgi:thiopeptide-type bacteriocin biosynthesis protein